MGIERERRNNDRMVKQYQIFCKAGDRSSVGETNDISEKGVCLLTNLDVQLGDPIEVRIVPKDEIFSFTCAGTVRYSLETNSDEAFKFRVGVEFIEGLKDFAADQLISGHEHISARKSLIINAPQKDCYDAICDFESYPSWQKVITEVNVIERYEDSRPLVVEFIMDALLKKIRFVNRYEYFDDDYILSWKIEEGDVKVNDGSYTFQKLREGKTNAIFSVYLELGFFAPKRLFDYLNNITMRNSIRALKEIAESGGSKK